MGLCDKYFSELKQRITDTIKAQPFTIQEQAALYKMSKILLTELINRTYSQEYIYWVVNDVFYNHQRLVDNIDGILNLFWSHFDFQEKEYTMEAQNPVFSRIKRSRCRSGQGINDTPTPFSASNLLFTGLANGLHELVITEHGWIRYNKLRK